MIILDPDNIGCGRKLPYGDLSKLQDYVVENFPEAEIGRDASTHTASSNVLGEACSIDRTVRFCMDDQIFVQAAICHASNDVVAAMAKPSFASISIGFSPLDIENGRHFSVSHALFRILPQLGIKVGKLHSFLDTESNITIGVQGAIERVGDLDGNCGSIYLSKPIGALKAVYLSNLRGEKIQVDAIQAITAASDFLLPIMVALKIGATDVSGFGLIHAVDQYMRGSRIKGAINLEDVLTVDASISETGVECLDRGIGYAPKFLAVENAAIASVGVLSEVNGPLVLFVPRVADAEFREWKSVSIHRIGHWWRDE